MAMAEPNPILNNPYREPEWHYATNLEGELDYEKVEGGRRVFTGELQTIPVPQRTQLSLVELNEFAAREYGNHLVNVLRQEIYTWRNAGYPNTTRMTRELFHFWFKNKERDFTQSLFFAQQEAIETAIYLNEVAENSNVGQRLLSDLEKAQVETERLPRIAYKMATGTGKTVVMGALIVYHFFNRREYRNDVRFADNFLIVTPGITIRDRLAALRVDNRTGVEAQDYYYTRTLVPSTWRGELHQLNAKLVIVNYQQLQAHTLQGNKRSPFDGKIGENGRKVEAREDAAQVLKRVMGKFRPDSRLLVINDEAHHCYSPRYDQRVAEGEVVLEEPPRLPDIVKAAFKQFYEHYQEEYKDRRHSLAARGTQQLEIADTPPVCIFVCNNTSVSKEVFKYVAGYAQEAGSDGESEQAVPGVYDLFSNFDPDTRAARSKPPTLLIDSDALENSNQVDDEFRRVFAKEIEQFKRDYALRHGQGAADQITDAEILREVVNTVGKPNSLGAHIRCVVSVSMLTEGWDANNVTHIVGLRAFGSQLLCEQVAGRALRRQSYFLKGYDKAGNPTTDKRSIVTYKFPPEYAHIIGVPFKLFKGGKTPRPGPVDVTPVFAVRERTEKYEITFPNIEGYRVDYPEGELTYSFEGIEDYEIDGSILPTKTIMTTGVDGQQVELSIQDILQMRDQRIVFEIAKALLREEFSDDQGNP